MAVTVYTLPSCVQCDQSKRFLKKNNIEFTEVDLSTDEAAMAHVKALGHMSAPVIETETANWSGFRPDHLNALVAAQAA